MRKDTIYDVMTKLEEKTTKLSTRKIFHLDPHPDQYPSRSSGIGFIKLGQIQLVPFSFGSPLSITDLLCISHTGLMRRGISNNKNT